MRNLFEIRVQCEDLRSLHLKTLLAVASCSIQTLPIHTVDGTNPATPGIYYKTMYSKSRDKLSIN